ncbi:hypothetical protein K525DRAFT_291122 [Schizophyllum commune Loenen D]|nr:hypothetical protein K525DRAFT_291122 [Schizophyllum commune Loenen D]
MSRSNASGVSSSRQSTKIPLACSACRCVHASYRACDGFRKSPSCERRLRPGGSYINSSYADKLLGEPASGTTAWSHDELEAIQTTNGILLVAPYSQAQEAFPPMIPQLVDDFLPWAEAFGFFLNKELFRSSLNPSNGPVLQYSRAHLSSAGDLACHEATYLAETLQQLATALSQDHPLCVFQTIQAEVLLSTYIFRQGHQLEGQVHAGAAGALAMGARLHKAIRASGDAITVPSADDDDKINAFWEVYGLTACWSSHFGYTSCIGADNISQIETPWPGAISIPDAPQTLLHFPSAVLPKTMSNTTSFRALRAQAVFLYETSVILARQYHPGTSTLASPGYPPHSPQVARILLLIHTLVHAAVMKLNEVFIKHEPTSWARYVASAEAVVDLYVSSPMNNPYTSTLSSRLWSVVADALITALHRMRSVRPFSFKLRSAHSGPLPKEEDVSACLQKACAVMALIALDCPLRAQQLQKVQASCQTV